MDILYTYGSSYASKDRGCDCVDPCDPRDRSSDSEVTHPETGAKK